MHGCPNQIFAGRNNVRWRCANRMCPGNQDSGCRFESVRCLEASHIVRHPTVRHPALDAGSSSRPAGRQENRLRGGRRALDAGSEAGMT